MKDRYIKELHKVGIRRGIKNTGEEVSLEHLKIAEVINLWYKYCSNGEIND